MTSFPNLTKYIDSLPQGLDSYPEAMQKASVTHSLFKAWPGIVQHAHALPLPLQNLVMNPPPASLWVPAVHAYALWVLTSQVHTGGDPACFSALSLAIDRDVLSMPIYGMIFRVLGERLTVRAVGVAFSSFHRGIEQTVTLRAPPRSSCATPPVSCPSKSPPTSAPPTAPVSN